MSTVDKPTDPGLVTMIFTPAQAREVYKGLRVLARSSYGCGARRIWHCIEVMERTAPELCW